MFVALFNQHANQTCHLLVCGMSGCTIFLSTCLKNGTIFEKKKYRSYWS